MEQKDFNRELEDFIERFLKYDFQSMEKEKLIILIDGY